LESRREHLRPLHPSRVLELSQGCRICVRLKARRSRQFCAPKRQSRGSCDDERSSHVRRIEARDPTWLRRIIRGAHEQKQGLHLYEMLDDATKYRQVIRSGYEEVQ